MYTCNTYNTHTHVQRNRDVIIVLLYLNEGKYFFPSFPQKHLYAQDRLINEAETRHH